MVDEQYTPDDADYIYSPGSDGTLVVEVWNGINTSLVLTRTYTTLTADFQTYVITFTSGERAVVNNWRDLTVHLIVNDSDVAILRMDGIETPVPGTVTLYVRARKV